MGNKLFSHCLLGYKPLDDTAGKTMGGAAAAQSSRTGRGDRTAGLCAVGQPRKNNHTNPRQVALKGEPAAANARMSHRDDDQYGADSTCTRVEGQFGSVTVTAVGRGGGIGAGGTAGEMAVSGSSSVISSNEILFAKNYKLKGILGKGSTSTCYRCFSRRTNKPYACKVG